MEDRETDALGAASEVEKILKVAFGTDKVGRLMDVLGTTIEVLGNPMEVDGIDTVGTEKVGNETLERLTEVLGSPRLELGKLIEMLGRLNVTLVDGRLIVSDIDTGLAVSDPKEFVSKLFDSWGSDVELIVGIEIVGSICVLFRLGMDTVGTDTVGIEGEIETVTPSVAEIPILADTPDGSVPGRPMPPGAVIDDAEMEIKALAVSGRETEVVVTVGSKVVVLLNVRPSVVDVEKPDILVTFSDSVLLMVGNDKEALSVVAVNDTEELLIFALGSAASLLALDQV